MKILYLVYEVNKLKNKYVNDSVVKTLTVNNIRDKNDYFIYGICGICYLIRCVYRSCPSCA